MHIRVVCIVWEGWGVGGEPFSLKYATHVYILHAYYGWYMHLGLNYSCYSMIHMKNFIGLLYLEIFISSGQLDKS